MTKKEKIIQQSTAYFTKNGYGESSLQDLANALSMSRGNLAYHFSNKEDILKAIRDKMWAEIAEIRVPTKQFPSFENVQNEVQLFYNIQQKYAFVFGDIRILKHPLLINKLYNAYLNMKSNAQEAIAFSIQLENMKEEPFLGIYNNIIDIVWNFALFWSAIQYIKKKRDDRRCHKDDVDFNYSAFYRQRHYCVQSFLWRHLLRESRKQF